MASDPFLLQPAQLTLSDLRDLARALRPLALPPETTETVAEAQRVIEQAVEAGAPVYGVNTGVGTLSSRSIAKEDLEELQSRMIFANATGTGPLLDDGLVRRILLLKINTLASGRSGVRQALIDALVQLHNAAVYPCIPSKGSVGASGDLAPLAHLTAALLGEGEVRVEGETLPAVDGLARAGLAPLRLAPKEAVAMLNGTQVSTALAVEGLFAVEKVFAAALVAGALSLEAALGQEMAFDPRLHAARGQPGQIRVAAVLRDLLAGSGLRAKAAESGRMQDPYSLRCQPQVMGACLDFLDFAGQVIGRELNGITDNPLVFAESGEILYGGNFHGEPIGLAADGIALTLSEVGGLAERRIALLVDEHHSGLPAFLADESGLNSGFMTAQISAAALASETKSMTQPASADSIPTVGNHEDFVSMATHAARRLTQMADNVAGVVAIELLCACQGLEFHRPARSSDALEGVVAAIRSRVAPYHQDRFLAPDIWAVKELIRGEKFVELVPLGLGTPS